MPLSHWYAKDDTAIPATLNLSALALLLMATMYILLDLPKYHIGSLCTFTKSCTVSILLSHLWVRNTELRMEHRWQVTVLGSADRDLKGDDSGAFEWRLLTQPPCRALLSG